MEREDLARSRTYRDRETPAAEYQSLRVRQRSCRKCRGNPSKTIDIMKTGDT